MEQNVIPLLYLTGVLQVALSVLHSVPHVYHLILKPSTWTSAQTYCRDNYVDLATVITSDDWINFQNERQSRLFTSLAWVGLYNDVNSWRWSYDSTALQLKKWAFAEPNNKNGNESCGALDTNGYWWDLDCTLPKPFLCYDATSSDKFIGISTVMSWPDAQAYCRQHYTDLATSNSAVDNSLLKDLVKGQWSAWFGLFRDTWKWSDQSNASSIDWMLGSPNNVDGNNNCGMFTVGYFVDAPCLNLLPFFCHTFPPVQERQIVKLHVTSNQNVNSPAVKTSILNVIQQYLNAHKVVENAKLTWRLQPNGNVFQKIKKKTTIGNVTMECAVPK